MNQLNIYDLQNEINKKKERRKETFKKILDRCHKKIIDASKHEQYHVIYEIPEFIPGLPIYNFNDCITYLIENLSNNGFKVQYHFPKHLMISWFPKINKQIEHNPDTLLFNQKDIIPTKNPKGKFVLHL
jgi:hypothetical protein